MLPTKPSTPPVIALVVGVCVESVTSEVYAIFAHILAPVIRYEMSTFSRGYLIIFDWYALSAISQGNTVIVAASFAVAFAIFMV